MKSLERRYNRISQRNPFWSSYISFAQAIRERDFSSQTIHRWFNKLVDGEDYDSSDKKDVLTYLEKLTKPLRTTEFNGNLPQEQVDFIKVES